METNAAARAWRAVRPGDPAYAPGFVSPSRTLPHLYYTGRAGQQFVSRDRRDAFYAYTEEAAAALAERMCTLYPSLEGYEPAAVREPWE